MSATVVTHQNRPYVQKSGVCIGSKVGPYLCDIFLAACGVAIQQVLKDPRVAAIFRYVDDFLILCTTGVGESLDGCLHTTLRHFQTSCMGLTFTYEPPVDNSIRFLDLALNFQTEHLCWRYEVRSGKGFLPFESEHSKIVKQGVATAALSASLRKTCPHQMVKSFETQMSRLQEAGYPKPFLASICEKICRNIKRTCQRTDLDPPKQISRSPFAVVPYIHGVTHRLKKIASRHGINIICSAPNKAHAMCRKVNLAQVNNTGRCTTKHKTEYVPCDKGVVYNIPLSCGRSYIGQTGRCINDRTREHAANLRNLAAPGHLAAHCRECMCEAKLETVSILAHHKDRFARELLEALAIDQQKDNCVSSPSIALQTSEKKFLRDENAHEDRGRSRKRKKKKT